MKTKILKYVVGSASVLLFAGSVAISSAGAQVRSNIGHFASISRMMSSTTRMSSSTKLGQRQNQAINTLDTRSTSEIGARITSLNNLLTRVNAMTKLSATQKTSITTEVQNLISDLTTLQTKIAVDASSTPVGTNGALASTSPLRTDIQSITKDYRVYALVIPQLDILAAADRAETIVASLTTLSGKLQTRITSALQASLNDLNAKIADAQTQANAAITVTASLTPDNGDTTVATSNTTALKTGRTDIQTASADIKSAIKDAQSIVKSVEGMNKGSMNGATVSASTSASVQ